MLQGKGHFSYHNCVLFRNQVIQQELRILPPEVMPLRRLSICSHVVVVAAAAAVAVAVESKVEFLFSESYSF
jgi:hypothetical protein